MSTKWQKQVDEIKKSIDQALASGATPIAAFDADGTLWDIDMGESFFDYQIEKKLLPDLPANAWNVYREMHARNAPTAFLWLAQINKGVALEQVRAWAQKAFEHMQPVPVFAHMQEVIRHLQARGVKVYVVTASIKWAVEPGAKFLGIPHEQVIGVCTQVHGGIVTDKLDGVVTWREGKVQGLLAQTGGVAPFFASGNTMGDYALLESATHLRMVNCAVKDDHANWATERKLVEAARKNGWAVFAE